MTPCLWYFWIYSFLGWLVELAFALASRSAERRRRCFLLLPLCPVYGLGMLAALALPPMGWLGLTVWGGLAATAVEYAVHWAGQSPGPGLPALLPGLGSTGVCGGPVHSAGCRRPGGGGPGLADLWLPAGFYRRRGVLPPVSPGDGRPSGDAAGFFP